MMKTTIKFLVAVLSVFFIANLIVSCSPEDGADGATGPQGEQGVAGPQGDQGDQGDQGNQGDQGDTGTANVIYSDWIARDFDTAAAAETNQQTLATFSSTDFNQDEDVLLVYGRRPANAVFFNVWQLPYILPTQNEYYGFSQRPFSTGSSVRIEVSTLDGGTNLFTYFDDFRYIIIPGGEVAGRSALNYEDMTYSEITKHFNIPE